MNPPDILGDDIIVGVADAGRFIYGSGEQRFQRRGYYLRSVSKRPLSHFRLGNRIGSHRSTLLASIDAENGFRHG